MKLVMAVLAAVALAAIGVVVLAGEAGSGGGTGASAPDAQVGRGEPSARAFRGGSPPPGQVLPRFRLRDQDGELLGPEDVVGRTVLVTFLDTQCTAACPLIASHLGEGLRRLTPEEREDVVALAITADPGGDTPRNVRAFLRRHRAPDVRYLTGSPRELRPVWDAFHVLPSADSGDDDIHSAPVRIFDGRGIWVTSLHPGVDLTPDNLAHDIRVALGKQPA